MATKGIQALRIPEIEVVLVNKLKMQAIEAGKSLQQHVIDLLQKAVKK